MSIRQILRKLIPGFLLFLMTTTVNVWAQTPTSTFSELQSNLVLKKGETIEVTRENGDRFRAKIASLSAQTLTVKVKGRELDLTESQVREIRREKPDSLKNGIFMGMAAGFAATFVSSASLCTNDPECSAAVLGAFILPFVGGGMGLGALLDASIHARETVFVRGQPEKHVSLQAAPLVSKQVKGMKLAFRF